MTEFEDEIKEEFTSNGDKWFAILWLSIFVIIIGLSVWLL